MPPPPPPAAVAPAAPRADAALSKSAPAAEAGSAGPRVQAQAAPPAPAAMLRPAATAVPAWDRLRLTLADGRVVELPRGQSGRIAGLVAALVLQARGGEPVPQPPQLRIVLMLGDTLAGTLEIAPPLAAWMPARAGQALVARPEPALLQALIDEALRLAQR
ncbi:MAG TPA: hypothetical protein VLJ58_19495 [Ramlibacter sp.]|nr:hypothetical protein [Ramlibacter sp.]